MKLFLIAFLVFVGASSGPNSAFAQNETSKKKPNRVDCDTHLPVEAQSSPVQLANRGIACFQAKEFVKALRFYRQAYRVEPSPVLTAAIGRALQELNLPSLAKPYFIEYLEKANLSEEAAAKIIQQLEKIDSQLVEAAELNLVTSEPGATVFLIVDGSQWEELGVSPLSIKLNEGNYEFMLKRKGFVTTSTSVDMVRGKSKTTFVELHDVNENFQISQRSWRRTGTYFIYGSVPLILAGTTLFTIGQIKTDDAQIASDYRTRDPLVSSGTTFKQFGLITGAVGIIGLAAGVVFYLNGSTAQNEVTQFGVSPTGVQVTHRF